MGIVYTTTYTSRLTSPGYEKPINTIKQFLDHSICVILTILTYTFWPFQFFKQELHICSAYLSPDTIEILNNSINEDHRQLSTRSMVWGENLLYRKQLLAERKCGTLAQRHMINYITARSINDDFGLMATLRIMKGCMLRQFTGFALQKHSPYTKLFDWHIRR